MTLVMTTPRSPEVLRAHMADGQWANRTFARVVEHELWRTHAEWRHCSPSTVAALRCGRQRGCRHSVARAMEEVLRVPAGALFEVIDRDDLWFRNEKAGIPNRKASNARQAARKNTRTRKP